MDIVSHAITGALVNATAFPAHLRRPAALVGAVGACLPDLDVLIRSASDPLLVLEYHRHFTHSLFFAPIASALATLLLWPLFRRRIGGQALYIAVLLGYVSACLLDVFTSYGTHLLWPLVQVPIALNMIAVVDPVFTLLISLGLAFALWQQSSVGHRRWLRGLGLLAAAAYLSVGALQLQRAEGAALEWAKKQHVDVHGMLVKPTMGNVLLWRGIISTDETFQAIAVRPGLRATHIYPGDSIARLQPENLDLPENSRALRDINRFYIFAEGYLVQFPGEPHAFGDVRYAMLPTSVTPLWGIQIDKNNPAGDTEFFTRRDTSAATRETFLQMLAGKPVHDTLPQ